MKKIIFFLFLLIVFSLSAEGFMYYDLDRYFNEDLENKDVGGLYVNTVLADSTSEYWTYRVFQDDIDYFDRSCRSINGIEELPAGFYEVRFPFNHLAYPPVQDVQIVTGYVTVINVYIGSRVILTTDLPAVTFHLYNTSTGQDVGKNEKIIYAGEQLNYDILPGSYRITVTNVFETPEEKPDESMEEEVNFDFDIYPWQIMEIDM
ncbi:MAG: hypothetical protein K9N09_08470 [Candidatus Cloacimonetes bacterium]|nr:hypothetical protein [Candidatus Cloacimonadota bacterium]MCF7814133.1 hypothetical protein [Candidatus Cloacimonadota bacterium]MCF7868718.1 hypothetical protein [Candidatus Cloacimonadota bacterium]MCF7884132.1 hypothetical protein [Candidatus Cloacimonadota bacterium]